MNKELIKNWVKKKGVNIGLSVLALGGLAGAEIGCSNEKPQPKPTATPKPTTEAPRPTVTVTATPKPTVRTPEVRPGPKTTPEVKPTYTPPAPTTNIDPTPVSYGPGATTFAGPNKIFVGDIIVNGVRLFDDREDTGLIVDMRTNASISFPYGGDEVTKSDPAQRAAEIERQKQIMNAKGKRADVIVWDGRTNPPTQLNPQGNYGFPQPDFSNLPNYDVQRSNEPFVLYPNGEIPAGVTISVGPTDFIEGDVWITTDKTYYLPDSDPKTGVIFDFKVYAQVTTPYPARLVRVTDPREKLRKIAEARDQMQARGILTTQAPYRVDVIEFTGDRNIPGVLQTQRNQRGY